jgi:hypothetical protein
VILSTLSNHVSHWLHPDLPARVAEFGYPVITVRPTQVPKAVAAQVAKMEAP